MLVNDENNSAIAQPIAQTLVNDGSVLGVVGHYDSDVTLATAPIYEEGKLVTITAASTALNLSGVSPYLYRTVPSDSFAAAALSAYMLYYRNNRKVAIYYDSTDDPSGSLREAFKGFVTAWGGAVVAEYDLSQSNFDPKVQQDAEEKGADTLMLAPGVKTLPAAAAVINFNQRRLPILGGDELYNRAILAETGPDALALTVAVPWHLLSKDSVSDFVASSRQLWKGDVSWRTATTYDAVVVIATGLKGNPTRAGLKAALDSNN